MIGRTLAMTVLGLALATPAVAQETTCPHGRRPAGDLGIEELRCSSGRCLRGFAFEDGRLIQTYTTEPSVHELEPPADAVLQEGDVLVSVDGNLSTTSDAARGLARVEPGDRVRLRIRRDGVERDVTITAAATCEHLGENFEFRFEGLEALEKLDWDELGRDLELHVQPDLENLDFDFQFDFDTLNNGLFARAEPPYELGLELTCGFFCGWRRGEGDSVVWRGQHPPKVAGVVEGGPADRAGIREGDVLLLLDGHSFVGEEGGRALGRLGPGRPLTLQYLRSGETLTTTTITPRAPTTR